MEVDQNILSEIYKTLEPYVIMTKLILKNGTDLKIELQQYNVRIFIFKSHWGHWFNWYRFSYEDNKIYMVDTTCLKTFENINQFKEFLTINYNDEFLTKYCGEEI